MVSVTVSMAIGLHIDRRRITSYWRAVCRTKNKTGQPVRAAKATKAAKIWVELVRAAKAAKVVQATKAGGKPLDKAGRVAESRVASGKVANRKVASGKVASGNPTAIVEAIGS